MGYNKRYYKDKARKKRIKKRKADYEILERQDKTLTAKKSSRLCRGTK